LFSFDDVLSHSEGLGARYYGNTMGRFLTPDWSAKTAGVPYAEFTGPYELVLVDYQMPEMDGFELARRISARSNLSDSMIMMLTSDDCNMTIARCEAMGIKAHLVRPIKQRELMQAIQKLFAQERASRQVKTPAGCGISPGERATAQLRILVGRRQ
jgi:CheY-like chemotaxis protein